MDSLKATLEEECADLSAESRCREFEKNMDSLAQLTNAAKVSEFERIQPLSRLSTSICASTSRST